MSLDAFSLQTIMRLSRCFLLLRQYWQISGQWIYKSQTVTITARWLFIIYNFFIINIFPLQRWWWWWWFPDDDDISQLGHQQMLRKWVALDGVMIARMMMVMTMMLIMMIARIMMAIMMMLIIIMPISLLTEETSRHFNIVLTLFLDSGFVRQKWEI